MTCLIFFVNPYISEQEHNQKCKYNVDVTITTVDQTKAIPDQTKASKKCQSARTASTHPNPVMGRLLDNAVFFSSLLLFLKSGKERHG